MDPSRPTTPAPPVITGLGAFVPGESLSNAEVAGIVDAGRLEEFVRENAWCARRASEPGPSLSTRELYAAFVSERLGIRDRRVVDREAILGQRPSERGLLSSDLGAEASRRALAAAGLDAADLDVVVCGSSSPDRFYPGTAVRVQALLGAKRAYSFDVLAACSSFVFALAAARALVLSGGARRVLVVAAEAFTYGVDWRDPGSAAFFGDGAAAAVLEQADLARGRPGLALTDVACWSDYSDNIRTGLGGNVPFVTAQRLNGHAPEDVPGAEGYPYFFQDGPAVFRDLIPIVDEVLGALLARHGLTLDDLDLALLHQASGVMVEAVERRVLHGPRPGLSVPRNLERYGNTSSAGAALLLAEEPPLAAGRHGVVLTFGGGYAVGAALLRGR